VPEAPNAAVELWSNLKNQPLAVVVSAVILAVSISWAVALAVMVEPRNQKIEQLQSQMASAQKAATAAAACPEPLSAETGMHSGKSPRKP
jgi:hypothetical protein